MSRGESSGTTCPGGAAEVFCEPGADDEYSRGPWADAKDAFSSRFACELRAVVTAFCKDGRETGLACAGAEWPRGFGECDNVPVVLGTWEDIPEETKSEDKCLYVHWADSDVPRILWEDDDCWRDC